MWVTKKEIEEAKQYDVLEYLRIADPGELVRCSANEYCLRTHDSFRISNGKWHWMSKGIGGRSAVDYLIKVKGYSFQNAIKEVNRAMKGNFPSFFNAAKAGDSAKKFVLPEKNDNNDIAIAYLKSRGINEDVVKAFIRADRIYESKAHHSVVFVGKTHLGAAAFASYRATDGSNRKGDFRGSNKRYSFSVADQGTGTVRVFESPIDLLSYVTLGINGLADFEDEGLLSLSGVSGETFPVALSEYLNRNSETKRVILHLDNDEVGAKATRTIQKTLEGKYEVINIPPPVGKDFNDFLKMEVTLNGKNNY